ncbi:MAG: metallophosphoesterase [Polyangiaceae bacterium]|nr:metallophosphoesterase [Polyangiaceae bacterium]
MAWLLGGGWVGFAAAAGLAAILTYLLRARIALLIDDEPVGLARRTAERLYFAHWGACLLSVVLLVPGSVLAFSGVVGIGAVAAAVYGVSLAIALYAVFIRTRLARVRTLDVFIAGLPAAFDGYRIAQLSDIHIGSLFPAGAAQRFVDATNRLDADLVALTGDYLTSGTRFHADVATLLGGLRAKDGTLAVWGNHDNYGDREPLRSLLIERGVHLLENESTRIQRNGASLTIVGVDDIFSRRADVAASFREVDGDSTTIALVHDPKQFPAIADRGAALVLTGHTHWGQVAVPLAAERVNLARRFFRFSGGLYRVDGAYLYVHPGIGATGPPLRFGVPPEITVIVLRSEKPQEERNRTTRPQ